MNTDYPTWIGKKVSKTALHKKPAQPKPFKSGLIKNTIKSLTINPHTNRETNRDKHIDKQRDKQRQTDRQTERQVS